MIPVHMNLEVSRSKLNILFLLLDISKLFTCTLKYKTGILYTLSPKLTWLWYIFWCQRSVEQALGNVHLTATSQNVKIQQVQAVRGKLFFEGSTFIYIDRPSLSGRQSFPRLALFSRYSFSQTLPSFPFWTHTFF